MAAADIAMGYCHEEHAGYYGRDDPLQLRQPEHQSELTQRCDIVRLDIVGKPPSATANTHIEMNGDPGTIKSM